MENFEELVGVVESLTEGECEAGVVEVNCAGAVAGNTES